MVRFKSQHFRGDVRARSPVSTCALTPDSCPKLQASIVEEYDSQGWDHAAGEEAQHTFIGLRVGTPLALGRFREPPMENPKNREKLQIPLPAFQVPSRKSLLRTPSKNPS